MKLLRSIAVASLVFSTVLLAASFTQSAHSAAFASAERKFAWLDENGSREHPSSKPTVVTEEEWNAYLNEGGVKLPEGLSNIHISSQPAMVRGDAEVDFDRLTGNRLRNHPLLELFSGTHHVTVTAQVAAAGGMGTVQVGTFLLDGVAVPRLALEYLADRFLRPKYGNAVGLDSSFQLPARIDRATVGTAQVTIFQR